MQAVDRIEAAAKQRPTEPSAYKEGADGTQHNTGETIGTGIFDKMTIKERQDDEDF